MSQLIYQLDKVSKDVVLASLEMHNMMEIVLGHITLYNDPEQYDLPRLERLFTEQPDVKLVGICSDANAVVGLVSVNGMTIRDANFVGRYHVTIAIGYGIKPTYANLLMTNANVIVHLPPVQLTGTIKFNF